MAAPEVSGLICDKISITYQPPFTDEQVIQDRMHDIMKTTFARMTKTLSYKRSARFCLDADFKRSILVQYGPYRSGVSFFRVEFNPYKDDMEYVRGAINCIIPAGYAGLIKTGKCTRIDATVDIHHADINDLIFTSPGLSRTSAHYAKGGVETYYLGAKAGDKQRCIYNKNAQLKSQGLTPCPHPVTRVECRLKQGFSLDTILSLDNPFLALNVAEFAALPAEDSDSYRLFRRLCAAEGGQNALLALSKNSRKKFRAYLQNGSASWWQPSSIWQSWPAAIAQLTASQPAFDFTDALQLPPF